MREGEKSEKRRRKGRAKERGMEKVNNAGHYARQVKAKRKPKGGAKSDCGLEIVMVLDNDVRGYGEFQLNCQYKARCSHISPLSLLYC